MKCSLLTCAILKLAKNVIDKDEVKVLIKWFCTIDFEWFEISVYYAEDILTLRLIIRSAVFTVFILHLTCCKINYLSCQLARFCSIKNIF